MERGQSSPQRNLGRKPPKWSSSFWYIPVMLLVLWMWQSMIIQFAYKSIPYSEFKVRLERREVVECVVKDDAIEGKIQPNPQPTTIPNPHPPATNTSLTTTAGSETKPFYFRTVRIEDPKLVDELQAAGGKFRGERPSLISQFMLAWVVPIGIMILIWSFISRRIGSAGESILSFGKSKARLVAEKETGITFNDVAGCEEAKYELQEVVDFLKHPERYKSIGANIPKGVLLIGPPGTGKTLLAKAVAGEAHVPFFSISGSDFVEMFVGVGAARVRDLFQQAKAKAPCIIFIDELDALGKARGGAVMGGHDEREQTLNQLLVEMDGFDSNRGVIIMAATNRPETLDAALLRPGRFDRTVVVDRPDIIGREAILKVHVRNVKLGGDVDLRHVASLTPGSVGADLANLVNEAALMAARNSRQMVTMAEFNEAIERSAIGLE